MKKWVRSLVYAPFSGNLKSEKDGQVFGLCPFFW